MTGFRNPLVDALPTRVETGGEFPNRNRLLEGEPLPFAVKGVMSFATTLGQTDTYRCDPLTLEVRGRPHLI